MCFAPSASCTFSTSQLPKVLRRWCALCILTWKCASRHSGVHNFDILNAKPAPNIRRFVHFDLENLETRFAPHRHATFHLSSGQMAPRRFSLASLLFDPPEPQIRFCDNFKNVGRRETFEADLQRCSSHGRPSTRDMASRDVRRSER